MKNLYVVKKAQGLHYYVDGVVAAVFDTNINGDCLQVEFEQTHHNEIILRHLPCDTIRVMYFN